jgi:hypothetical protein
MRPTEEETFMLRKLAFALAATVALSAAAYAQTAKTISITIKNTDNGNLLLKVADANQSGKMVFGPGSLKQGASTTVKVNADAAGKGHITWTAMGAPENGEHPLKCGKADRTGLADGASVAVNRGDSPSSC